MNKFEALLKKQISHIYTTKDPLLFHEPANEVPATSDYQRVSYMSSKGLFYIDTETKVKQNTKICIAVDVEDESLDQRICGAYGPGVSIATKNGYFRVFNANNKNELTDAPVLDNINIIESYQNKIKVNGREITLQNSTSASNSNIILFGANYQNSLYQVSDCRIYYCDIYEGETLVKSFIPAYHKTTHEVGMLDTVNNIFYKAKTQLPDTYQEVEYIKSTGTQYIDTNVNLSSSDTVKCKFEITSSTTSMADAIYGCHDSGNFFVLLMRSPTQARVGTSTNQATSTNIALNTIYNTTLSNGTYIENGTTYTFTPSPSFILPNSCYVMSRNQPNSGATPVSAKVYSFEIVGKFNGIPCYRKSDGVIGMYDLISKTFYDSETESTFVAGNETFPDIGTEIIDTSFVKKLPNAYQQLEYIESNGTQYIDTNYIPTESTIIETKFNLSIMENNKSLFGTFNTAESRFNLVTTTSIFAKIAGNLYISTTNLDITPSANKDYTMKFSLPEFTLNDKSYNSETYSYSSSTSFLYIFARNTGSSPDQHISSKIYYFKIYEASTLIHDYIPCYKKDDGQEGLYDLVSKTFYPEVDNKNFTRGQILDEYIEIITETVERRKLLPDSYQELEYIQSNSTQYIDPNILITSDIGFEITASIPTDIHGALLGNYLPGNYFFFVYGYDNGNTTFFPSKTASTVAMSVPRNTQTTFSFKNGVLDDGTTQITVPTYATAEIGQPIYIFSGRHNNWFTSYKLYNCKFYNGNTVIRNLIPCYKKLDGQEGLYDLISNTFYADPNNINFTRGPETNTYID